MIDYSKARLRDVAWWRRTNILIDAMDRDDEIALLKLRHARHCAFLSGNVSDDSFEKSQKKVEELYQGVLAYTQPWAVSRSATSRTAQHEGLIDLYKQAVGDPSDPAFAAKIQADYDANIARRKFVPSETEEARIDRLMRDRDSRGMPRNRL